MKTMFATGRPGKRAPQTSWQIR